MNTIIQKIHNLVEHRYFTNTIFSLILINAIVIGLETYHSIAANYSTLLLGIDRLLLWIFTVEIVLRIIGSRSIGSFFKDPWNVFDFLIVLSGFLVVGGYYITVLRIIRILRILRTVSVIPSLKKMVNALLLTIPSMGTIALLLGIFFYIYAVIGTMLFHSIAPEYFGTLHDSLLSLFQVVTLESWASGVMRPILADDPTAWWYFVSFILIGSFVIVNLFVGVIVTNVEEAHKEKPEPVERKLDELQKELDEIKTLLKNQQK